MAYAVSRLLENAQVELHGQYSVERQRQLDAYCKQANAFRVTSVLLLTPLPCLIVLTLADVPTLEDPTKGTSANYVFWIRAAMVTAMLSAFSLQQFKENIPVLELRRYQVAIVSITTALVVTSPVFAFSKVIGFPVPFLLVCSSVTYQVVLLQASLSCGEKCSTTTQSLDVSLSTRSASFIRNGVSFSCTPPTTPCISSFKALPKRLLYWYFPL